MAQRKARKAHNLEVTRSKRVAGIFQFVRFTESSRQSLRDVKLALHRCGAEVARRAHNPEVIRSKRITGIYHLPSFTETGRLDADVTRIPFRQSLRDVKLALHRCGAEEARGAHNPEVIGSNPIAGIFIRVF